MSAIVDDTTRERILARVTEACAASRAQLRLPPVRPCDQAPGPEASRAGAEGGSE